MPLAKVKSSKQKRRLEARQKEWERIPLSDKTGKSGKYSMMKPGSNRK